MIYIVSICFDEEICVSLSLWSPGHSWSDLTLCPHITPPSLAPDNSDNIGHWIPVWQLKETRDIDGEDWAKLDHNDQDFDMNMDFYGIYVSTFFNPN